MTLTGKRPHEYKDTSNIYDDEIGKIAGVRFIETTEAKVFHADDLTDGARDLTVKSASGKVLTVNETITTADAAKLAGREVVIGGVRSLRSRAPRLRLLAARRLR